MSGNPPAGPGASDKSTDRYLTPQWVLDCIAAIWPLGIDLDPFHDPRSHVVARHRIDIRQGGNAYADPWPGVRTFANGPYSGQYPQHTAKRCGWKRAQGDEVISLCPAAPGSAYWSRWVWPWATSIVWLGRLPFEAATDIYAKDGRLICKAGQTLKQNRTEIALVCSVDDPHLVRRVFARHAHVSIVD